MKDLENKSTVLQEYDLHGSQELWQHILLWADLLKLLRVVIPDEGGQWRAVRHYGMLYVEFLEYHNRLVGR